MGHGTHRSDQPALLAAALADIQADPARRHGFGWRHINAEWWKGLEAKLGHGTPEYERIVKLPVGYADEPDKRWPLILCLHGRGSGLDYVKDGGPLNYAHHARPLPFILVAPHTQALDGWEPVRLAAILD